MGGGGPHWAAKWIATNANQPNIRKEYIMTISGRRGGQHGKLLSPTNSMLFSLCRVDRWSKQRFQIESLFEYMALSFRAVWRALHVTVEGLSDLFKWVLLQPFIVRLFIHHILDDMLFCNNLQNNPPIMLYSKSVCLLWKLPLECSPINLGPVLKALYTLRTSSLHLIFHLTVNLSKTLNPVLRTYPMP